MLIYYLLFHTNHQISFVNSIAMLFNVFLFSMWPHGIFAAHHLNSVLNGNDSFLCGFPDNMFISGVRLGAICLPLGAGNGAWQPSVIQENIN